MLNPVRIYGVWDEGIVLDKHIIKSIFLGCDEKGKEKIDVVIPAPPSNKVREYQPVFEIAKEIAKYLNKECKLDILLKESNLQVKDGHNVSGMIKQTKKLEKQSNILIIDDLYSTGATLNETCKILRKDGNVKKIYCLAMTRTKG